MKFLKDLFTKDRETLVKTIQLNNMTLIRGDDTRDENGIVYFHLYESLKGKRRVEIATSFKIHDKESFDRIARNREEYQTKVVRWLSGRRDPEIPTYSQVGEEDVINQLKGHI